jgi:alkyldihydroxyacetonephosphate synthase
MAGKRRKFFGWGYEGEGLSQKEADDLVTRYGERYGVSPERQAPPTEAEVDLPAPRIELPEKLKGFCTADTVERARHTYGQSYPDFVKLLARDFTHAPDAVAFVTDEQQIAQVLEWAGAKKVAVIPYGGASSVVGGVEPAVGAGYNGTLSLDLTGLDKVVEVDKASRAARIQGGIRVPALEAALKPHGLTLRHFPQSFEMATLGGMIATRSGGHFATLYTHIDDFVESTRTVTPRGILESRRLPGSGAGPSPDRLMLGSEGALGIITEAWMRLQDRPTFRAGTAVLFPDVYAGAEAVRAISQAGLYPANVRLLDAAETQTNGFGDGRNAVLVLAFESADHDVDAWMARALAICKQLGGQYDEAAAKDPDGHLSGAAGAWRTAFIRMPYNREHLVPVAAINDTFETAITWDRFREFHDNVKAKTEAAIRAATGRDGTVTCRFTHTYPDGPAPYFSFHAMGRHGALLEQWQQIKTAASDAVIAHGGTITHHHAVGRDHMPWYRQQLPGLFQDALQGVKARLDPAGILNPGVLVDPVPTN